LFGKCFQPFVLILRCYAVAIAFFVALAETEWEAIFKLWRVRKFVFQDSFLLLVGFGFMSNAGLPS
jgi:hypothetical protein